MNGSSSSLTSRTDSEAPEHKRRSAGAGRLETLHRYGTHSAGERRNSGVQTHLPPPSCALQSATSADVANTTYRGVFSLNNGNLHIGLVCETTMPTERC